MKILFVIVLFAGLMPLSSQAQILKKLGKKIEQKAKDRAEQKTDATIDKGFDKAEQKIDKTVNSAGESVGQKNNEKSNENASDNEEINENESSDESANGASLIVNTDFDFVPGSKTIFSEDFAADNIGDFPAFWNTNGSGEVVTFGDEATRWLKIPDNTLTYPETKKALPINFTIEFNLLYPGDNTKPPINFGFSEKPDPVKNKLTGKMFYFLIDAGEDVIRYNNSIYSSNDNSKSFPFSQYENQVIPISISVNNTRIRLYVNQEKVFDLPKAFESADLRNNFHFRASPIIPARQAFYIANLRIAETGTDLRSQLLKNGRVSTTAIHFNVNSANVQPNSTGAIREIAKTMEANPGLKIKIVGHTDTDGEEAANQQLSRDRANSVKQILVANFQIDASRITTEGKGESEPVSGNATTAQKFENRRVEFIKM